MTTVSTSHTDVAFVTAAIDITGNRGGLLGRKAGAKSESGVLRAPRTGLVLWRVVERAEIEKRMSEKQITPAEDGQSVSYRYAVLGGEGGLLPIEEPGRFKADLVAVFAPPSFLPEVGKVEIVTADVGDIEAGERSRATFGKRLITSAAQLEGRLIRLPEYIGDLPAVWYVEKGARRILQSPACGRLRFGDGWQRLVQRLPSVSDLDIVPEGGVLTLAECAEGRLVSSWPDPRAYLIENGRKREILSDSPMEERYGVHWRIKLIDLSPADMALIPEGEALCP